MNSHKTDWYVWRDPTPDWVRAHSSIPGLQFDVALDGRVTAVTFHRSHWPIIPAFVQNAIPYSLWASEAGHFVVSMDQHLSVNCGVQLRLHQYEAIEFLRQRRNALLAFEMRLGKAQPLTALVLTPSGFRKMGDLCVGDLVIGRDGKPCHITGIYPRGMMEVFQCIFSDGAVTHSTDDHLWEVRSPLMKSRGESGVVRSLRAVKSRLVDGAGNRQNFIPLVDAIQFDDVGPLPLDPYVLGLLLGNGCLRNDSVRYSTDDRWTIDVLRARLPDDCEVVKAQSAYDWSIRGKVYGPNSVLNILRALGLAGRKSPQKFVPQMYKHASAADRLALLQGLCDTDGCTSDNYVEFASSSEQLANDVAFLVRSLGGTARLRSKRSFIGDCEYLPSYIVTVSLPAPLKPFKLPRKADRYNANRKFGPTRAFVSVESVGVQPVQCISVDAPDGLYVTDDFIVTHNTLAAAAAHDPSDGPLVVLGPLAARDVWVEWISRIYGQAPHVLRGHPTDETLAAARGHTAYFVHFEVLDAWTRLFCERGNVVGTLVIDEIHLLQSRKSKRSSATTAIAARSSRIFGLSGTPMWGRPDSLYAVLQLIAPSAWGSHFEFGSRYADARPTAYGWQFNGVSNADELKARLAHVMLRKTWQDCASNLPPTTRVVEPVAVPAAQQAAITLLATQIMLSRANAKMTVAGYLATLRRKLGEVKIRAAVDQAYAAIGQGHPKVVIWTWHKDLAGKIADAAQAQGAGGVQVGRFASGDDSDAVRDFKRCTGAAILVASIAAGGVAQDWSCSDYAIFAELDWTPANVQQAEMRTFSPLRPHCVVYLYADVDVEKRLIEALAVKECFASSLALGPDDITNEILK